MFTTIWNWFNGNKTIFGMFLLFVAESVSPEMVIWVIPVKGLFQWVGGILTGVGVIHKAFKADTTPAPNK